MPYVLLTFLIKEKVLGRFLDETSKFAHSCNIDTGSVYKNLRDPFMAIEYTFIWRYTKEGHNFWEELNNKYKSIWEIDDSGVLLLLSDC